MTPSKSKKALPSSTSTAFPVQPVTPEQWAAALHRVRELYFRGQLRQCAARCDQLLCEVSKMPNPLFASYLHFYAALSTEGLARLTHNFSSVKIANLLQAKESYRKAITFLPPRDDVRDTTEYHTSEADTEISPPGSDECCRPYPNLPTCPSSPSSLDLHDQIETPPPPQAPSPLRIHKKPTLHIITSICTPPRTPPPQIFSLPAPRPSSVNFSAATSIWLRTRARERFSAHVDSFRDMLRRHMDVVESLIRTAAEAQRMRQAGKRLGNSGLGDGDNATGEEERKRAAVMRGRERGWARPRFQPARYAALCEQALSEL